MKSMSLGRPHLTRSSSSLLVSVGRSTTTPGRLTFLRSLRALPTLTLCGPRFRPGRPRSACLRHGGPQRARAPGAAVSTANTLQRRAARSAAGAAPRAGPHAGPILVSTGTRGAPARRARGERAAGPGGRTPALRCSGICSAPCPPSRWWRAPPARWSRPRTGSASPAARPPPASCSCAPRRRASLLRTRLCHGNAPGPSGTPEHLETVGCARAGAGRPARRASRAPHRDERVVALGVIVGRDGDLFARGQLDGLVRVLEEACPDLWPLRQASRTLVRSSTRTHR